MIKPIKKFVSNLSRLNQLDSVEAPRRRDPLPPALISRENLSATNDLAEAIGVLGWDTLGTFEPWAEEEIVNTCREFPLVWVNPERDTEHETYECIERVRAINPNVLLTSDDLMTHTGWLAKQLDVIMVRAHCESSFYDIKPILELALATGKPVYIRINPLSMLDYSRISADAIVQRVKECMAVEVGMKRIAGVLVCDFPINWPIRYKLNDYPGFKEAVDLGRGSMDAMQYLNTIGDYCMAACRNVLGMGPPAVWPEANRKTIRRRFGRLEQT